jgi:hypothetical protein
MWINERVRRTLAFGVVVALTGVVAAGCGDDDPAPPTTGQIAVTTVTTGDTPDADGYALTLDGNVAGNIGVNADVIIPDLAVADYSVGLTNVAANCTVAGDNPRTLGVTAGLSTTTTFSVDCPGAPAAVTLAVATEADEVTLTWNASPLATSYRAELVGGTADLTKVLAAGATTAAFTATDDGLEDGVAYAATVYAINDEGETASNEESVDTNFFPWDEYFPTSLHETGMGKITYYSAANGGYERLTGVPYETAFCAGCHSSTDGRPPVSGRTCDRCHATNDPQLGVEDVDDSWDPATSKCLSCHSRQKAEMGAGWSDVHRTMGFGCMTCHTLGDVHGDGTQYDGLQDIGAIDANCTNSGCHSPTTFTHPAGDPHSGDVSCAACHAQTVTTCNNCHFEAELSGDGKVFPGPPKTGWMMLGNRFKRDGSGETEVYPVNFQSVKYTTAAFDSTTYVAFGYFTPHSIGTGRGCSDCHNNMGGTNPAIIQYNTDGFIDMAKWDVATSKLINPDGVVPIPEDYLTTLKFEFVSTDVLPPVWTFYKASADTIRIPTQWMTPLDAGQMSALGMTGP